MDADLRFWFDPVCPFAWLTSTWVRSVSRQRAYTVEWRFISLRVLNRGVDYASHFPPGYEDGHTAGLRLLRVAARVRDEHGNDGVAAFYEAVGRRVFEDPGDVSPGGAEARHGERSFAAAALADAGLPEALADAVDDASRDALVEAETEEALARTGRDVGTPIVQVDPPDGPAFFGPVISRRPSDEDALRLWDHVVGLASFGGFAELKRSLREVPQLPGFGGSADAVGEEQDWHAGRRV